MVGLLWSLYKDRMGVSCGIDMLFDLEDLIQPVPGFESLSEPFSDEEINEVLKHLPQARGPGPYGFTGLFVKRCWHIIKDDFLKLISDFY